jgi:hypothetical protein
MSLLSWLLERIGMQIVPSVDHLALYRAKVVAQSGDFRTVDVKADDIRIGSLSGVDILLGTPATTVDLAAGITAGNVWVRVGWRAGDPRYPFVESFESGATVTRFDLDATTIDLNNGTKGAARKDDTLTASLALSTWATAMENGLLGVGGAIPVLAFSAPGGAGTAGNLGDVESCSASVKIGG